MTSALPPFQVLLDEHGADLHRFLVASVGRHDGDDCFQETIVSALRAYPDLRDASNLRGWLFTIAYRKIVDRARADTRHGAPSAELPDRAHVDGQRDPELWVAVRDLPPKQRAAIVERFVFDRPYAEIAELIDSSEDAARQNVRAGLARLREVVTR
jgi:RNA polymerase sigma factor (sigma-70 family)